MKRSLPCLALLLLAACKPATPPPAPAIAEPPATVAPEASPRPVANAPAMAPPSFDCAKAESAAEKLVCGDAELAALDRQIDDEDRQRIATVGLGIVAISLGILFEGQNIAFLVGLTFGIAGQRRGGLHACNQCDGDDGQCNQHFYQSKAG